MPVSAWRSFGLGRVLFRPLAAEPPAGAPTIRTAGAGRTFPSGLAEGDQVRVILGQHPLGLVTLCPIGRQVIDPLGNPLFVLRGVWFDGYVAADAALLAVWRAAPSACFAARIRMAGLDWVCAAVVEGVQWESAEGPARIQGQSRGRVLRAAGALALPYSPAHPTTAPATSGSAGEP